MWMGTGRCPSKKLSNWLMSVHFKAGGIFNLSATAHALDIPCVGKQGDVL